MVKLSLILVVNKQAVYDDFLESLNTQDLEPECYEVLRLENCDNQFIGAGQAYDSAAKQAKGAYLVFMHPDIRFLQPTDLRSLLTNLEQLGEFGVVGVAGCPEELENGKRVIVSNIVHGADKAEAGRRLTGPVPVQTVDECLFIVRRQDYLKVRFGCREGWHLHAVELCLRFADKGYCNYVVPCRIWHLSAGASLDHRYMLRLKVLLKEYAPALKTLNTTVKKWEVHGLKAWLYRCWYTAKIWIKRTLLRR